MTREVPGGPVASRRDVLVFGASAVAGAALPLVAAPAAAATVQTEPSRRGETSAMSKITTKDGVDIFYKDWGKGQPIVFSHGWPLSADDWDAQMLFFLAHGYRVIAHDRRGHGRSSQVSDGH